MSYISFCSTLLFQKCLHGKQSWKIEIVSASGTESRFCAVLDYKDNMCLLEEISRLVSNQMEDFLNMGYLSCDIADYVHGIHTYEHGSSLSP